MPRSQVTRPRSLLPVRRRLWASWREDTHLAEWARCGRGSKFFSSEVGRDLARSANKIPTSYRLVAATPAVAVAVAVVVTLGDRAGVGEGAGDGSVARCRAMPTEVAPRPPSVTSSHACRRR